ncbi:MAG: MnhB domain-containing protein [Gallionellaceae bacterium]|nr:MnhB domain-containing protein [Gallionellaceae bacterium]
MLTRYGALLFAAGFAFLLFVLFTSQPLGAPTMLAGQAVLNEAAGTVGAANIVTAVVLAYRGIDTLGELSILFAAATAVGLVLGRSHGKQASGEATEPGGFILRAGSDLLFPLLLVVGFYIIVHGHLTPGGGFQGGVVLAAAFVLPVLARPSETVSHAAMAWVEGLAGTAFIATGLAALAVDHAFLAPLLGTGQLGALLSGGTLPLLYLAVGLKVGAELASLLLRMTEEESGT